MAATSGLWSLALFMAAITAKWNLNSRLTADGVVRGFMLFWRRNTSLRDWGVVQEDAGCHRGKSRENICLDLFTFGDRNF